MFARNAESFPIRVMHKQTTLCDFPIVTRPSLQVKLGGEMVFSTSHHSIPTEHFNRFQTSQKGRQTTDHYSIRVLCNSHRLQATNRLRLLTIDQMSRQSMWIMLKLFRNPMTSLPDAEDFFVITLKSLAVIQSHPSFLLAQGVSLG